MSDAWDGPEPPIHRRSRGVPTASVLALLFGAAIASCPAGEPAPRRFQFRQTIMAVPVTIALYARDEGAARRAARAAFARIHALEAVLSDYDPTSEVRRLCGTAGRGRPVPVSADLWRVLRRGQILSERTGGAFDVTIGPVVRLWRRARVLHELPEPDRLRRARALVDYRLVRLDPARRTVHLLQPGMRLDLGGIGKGYAVDEALKLLKERGVPIALVDAGGDIALGDPPPGRPGWRIGVASPRAGAPPGPYLLLSRVAVATSGDTYQHVTIRGRRYSHIVDPRTGIGLTGSGCVTIVAPDGMTADALATAVSVLGPEKGLRLIDGIPGAAGRFVRVRAGKEESHVSKGWRELPREHVPEAGQPPPKPNGDSASRPDALFEPHRRGDPYLPLPPVVEEVSVPIRSSVRPIFGCCALLWASIASFDGARAIAAEGGRTAEGGRAARGAIPRLPAGSGALRADAGVRRATEVRSRFAALEGEIERYRRDGGVRRRWEAIAHQALRRESLIFPSDRDPVDVVLRRTEALLAHLESVPGAPDLSAEEELLARWKAENGRIVVEDGAARYRLFEKILRLRRRIAFSNPLLDFDRILFIERHSLPSAMTRGNHMCDQYFGFHAIRGGGLFVLEDAFGENPIARNIAADSVCRNGRFRGKKLPPGGFLSPDLSYDGKTILFAYTEAEPTRYVWTERSTFHIFKVDGDGSDLVQLTDGPVNDFDPCWLPDGRIAFISERRGGYGRCHPRPVPIYTLHAMDGDGTGIVPLSHHEANEWQPSVAHDGMILYTRWDYVDRGNIQAHHPWVTTPDGRDPRPIHGNYRRSQDALPTMELDIRAIPASPRYVATAAAHHGQAYGSLVVIDPRVEDDGTMAPVRRITPEVPFPEAETGANLGQVYATPWPLSEIFYLCVYDAHGSGARGRENDYGIYLLDAFGNKECIWRDPEISCLSPIPLRERKRPPVLPRAAAVTEGPGAAHLPMAEVGVIDVYRSRRPFPEGTIIRALRIIQVLPKTTPRINEPRIGYGNEKGARRVLGTVPVERDGSAHFLLPPGKPVYFQALDERGLAVQSMHSDTYAHPGERLLCQGCHAPLHSAPPRSGNFPLALRRPPSRIRPEVEGANPFGFPRLVQPVLDRACVRCHERDPAAFDLGRGNWRENPHRWYSSYIHLMPYASFSGRTSGVYDPWTPPETTPGRFGARASRLYRILADGHHGVELSREDLHRITLWLDCNSDFFGSYKDTEAQAEGEIVQPALE